MHGLAGVVELGEGFFVAERCHVSARDMISSRARLAVPGSREIGEGKKEKAKPMAAETGRDGG